MNRIDFLNVVYSQCRTYDYRCMAQPNDILAAVYKYKIGKPKKAFNEYTIIVRHGCLFLDNDFIIRVEPLIRPFLFVSDKADYYEASCIFDLE